MFEDQNSALGKNVYEEKPQPAFNSGSADLTDLFKLTSVVAVDNVYAIDFQNQLWKNVKITTADAIAKTVTNSNAPDGAELFIELTYTNAAAITWFANIIWLSGAAPTFTAGKTYRLAFYKTGANWHGSSIGGW